MEESRKEGGVHETRESRNEPLLSTDVESASGNEASSWRLDLQTFPALPERPGGDQGSFTLRRFLRTPSKPPSLVFSV